MDYTTYLVHHGIKGMKWGVRRYQNPDGSLTAAGKKRYLKSLNPDLDNKKAKELSRELHESERRFRKEYDPEMALVTEKFSRDPEKRKNEEIAFRVNLGAEEFINAASAKKLEEIRNFLATNTVLLSSANETAWQRASNLWLEQENIGNRILRDLKLDDRLEYTTRMRQLEEDVVDDGGLWSLYGEVSRRNNKTEDFRSTEKIINDILEQTQDWTWKNGKRVPNPKKVKQMGFYSPSKMRGHIYGR